jgi:amidase
LEKGAIILGKTNLSEWANFMCLGCPNGYSAMGGQTLNAYGPRQFDTGGSSSGSGVSAAANYAAATIGTETSGSILSPSSKSSLVGLKPTIGLFSRSGIVPISSTLDTPGPMTRNVTDNAILLAALSGEDSADTATKDNPKNIAYWEQLSDGKIEGIRFGVLSNFLEDSLYKLSVEKIEAMGGVTVVIEPTEVDLDGFSTLLKADMRIDLKNYLENYASSTIEQHSVEEIVAYNRADSAAAMPYGQGRFEGVLEAEVDAEAHEALKAQVHEQGIKFFEVPMVEHDLDFVLSVNNRNAGFAAAAKYPCLTIPMGYGEDGEPAGLTFIARPFEEDKLLKVGYAYEQATKHRKMPAVYQ